MGQGGRCREWFGWRPYPYPPPPPKREAVGGVGIGHRRSGGWCGGLLWHRPLMKQLPIGLVYQLE